MFIGNVPKIWTEDEFRKVIEEVGPGVEHIELIKVRSLNSSFVMLIWRLIAAWINVLMELSFVNCRIPKIQAEIVVLLLFCIIIMPALIIQDRKCQIQILGWMEIHQL